MSSHEIEQRSPREPRSGRSCVLIVDDEVSIRSALTRYFERRGWEVRVAEDGETARAMLEPNAGGGFDAIVCDLHMPRYSGFELFRWLERARPDLICCVVLSTGDADSTETAEFLREARRPVLPKPFELRELARIIDEVQGAAQAA